MEEFEEMFLRGNLMSELLLDCSLVKTSHGSFCRV